MCPASKWQSWDSTLVCELQIFFSSVLYSALALVTAQNFRWLRKYACSDSCEDLQCPTAVLASSTAARAVFLPTADGVIDSEPKATVNHLTESSAPTQAGTGCPGGTEPGLYTLSYVHCALILFLFLFSSVLPYCTDPIPFSADLQPLMVWTYGLKISGAEVKSPILESDRSGVTLYAL